MKLFGAKKDPLAEGMATKLALSVFFAWIGLGADGISSSCYGPEQAFLALGADRWLAFWLVILTVITVLLITYSYNRIIKLFPNGGGGYKVATSLLGEHAGLLAGIGLTIDYILTIVISVSSGIDALFSLSTHYSNIALQVCSALIIMLFTYLNMRGMKESIRVLVPIFLGFIIIHICLISYGFFARIDHIDHIVHLSSEQGGYLWHNFGFIFIFAIFLHAYAQGGGTYTGLEAVSNSVNMLKPPRVKTGQKTMVCMAISLCVMAGGILFLYLLWDVQPSYGETLNAVLFSKMLGSSYLGHIVLIVTLVLEAGLLFIAANTGFLGGPAVLSNMAMDEWVPKVFINISSRLVRQNGILLFGAASLMLLFITDGRVSTLVIIYSISVFLAFTISLFGLLKYYWENKKSNLKSYFNLLLVAMGVLVCATVLIVIVITSFTAGSWIALILIGLLYAFCIYIRKDYVMTNAMLQRLDDDLCYPLKGEHFDQILPNESDETAIILVGNSRGAAMHTLLTIRRLFDNHYKNFIFLSFAVVDSKTVVRHDEIKKLKDKRLQDLVYLTNFCYSLKLPALYIMEVAVDPIEKLHSRVKELAAKYPRNAFFASQMIFSGSNWIQKINHNKTALAMQREIYSHGFNMMILPVKVDIYRPKRLQPEMVPGS